MSTGRSSRRALFRHFSSIPNGIPVTDNQGVVYSVEPLHAEIMIAHRLVFQCIDPYCGDLHLYDDTFWAEVIDVLSTRPEDIPCEPDMPFPVMVGQGVDEAECLTE